MVHDIRLTTWQNTSLCGILKFLLEAADNAPVHLCKVYRFQCSFCIDAKTVDTLRTILEKLG